MKNNLLLPFCLLLCGNLLGQSFQIGHKTITLIDAARNNRSIPTEVYYPADNAGDNVPVTTASTAKFPVLSFGHGFVMTWDAYQNIWEAVVPEGFIIAFPKTEGTFAPTHAELGKDLAFVTATLTAMGQDNASLFFGRVDTMNCVMGHSMGGGGAFLAAQFSPQIKALATFAPAETTPSAIQAAANLSIPSIVFAGRNDCVTPPPAHQIPMYNALQSTCKTYIEIIGGSHCQMAANNLLCSFGEGTCTPAPAITRAEQHAVINRYLLPWLKKTLKSDCVAGALFDSQISTDASISFEKNCVLCQANAVTESPNRFGITISPNPFSDHILIQWDKPESRMVALELYAVDGRKVFSRTAEVYESLTVDLPGSLAGGVYVVVVMKVDGERAMQKIVRE